MDYWILDVVLLIVLLGYLFNGLRRGFVRGIGGIIGLLLGGIAAFFLVPFVGGFIADSFWRTVASIGIALVLLVLGHGLGARVGRAIARSFDDSPLRVIDRILGAVVGVIVTALVMSLIAASVSSLGVPLLSQAVGKSAVISTIDRLTPPPVATFLAKVRSTAVRDTIPTIVEALGGVTTTPSVPKVDTETDALRTAAKSVVRISGNAYACGQSQSGSGFVIAPDRVVTNAHVVAGVTEPVVEAPDGEAIAGRIVYFDPTDDLAVVAVDGLRAKALPLSPVLGVGATAAYQGYPFGGPFVSGPAKVLAVGTEKVDDVYGSPSPREVYSIAADIQQGDSGGPLLATNGSVAGVVFAKSAQTADLGYAMTVNELSPVVGKAQGLTSAVSTGRCING